MATDATIRRVIIAFIVLVACLIGLGIFGKLTGVWDRPESTLDTPSSPVQ